MWHGRDSSWTTPDSVLESPARSPPRGFSRASNLPPFSTVIPVEAPAVPTAALWCFRPRQRSAPSKCARGRGRLVARIIVQKIALRRQLTRVDAVAGYGGGRFALARAYRPRAPAAPQPNQPDGAVGATRPKRSLEWTTAFVLAGTGGPERRACDVWLFRNNPVEKNHRPACCVECLGLLCSTSHLASRR